MACFLVAAAVGIVTTGLRNHIPEKYHINWLNIMIWSGVLALLVEHIWHGEIVPWFPFLTAMSDPADKAEMLHEMSTVGVTMAVLITLVWLGMLAASSVIEKRALNPQPVKG